jgi:8-oxo-dGTP pyrophosphatase MutT (NUDIX family)
VEKKQGAGLLPFAVHDDRVLFLFQTTFRGRKAGHLTDFGGGVSSSETPEQAAVREFIEETETMYFCDDLSEASRSVERIEHQLPMVRALLDQTLAGHPDWWCRRTPGNPSRPRGWKTFFMEIPYRDVDPLNREWEGDTTGRFRKRRALFWVPGDDLIAIYASDPGRLWKRVRQLEGAADTVRAILRSKGSG